MRELDLARREEGGVPKDEANAKGIIALKTKIGEAQWDRVKRRDADKTYDPKTLSALEKEMRVAALPETGSTSPVLVITAIGATVAGAMLIAASRRRRTNA